ncbi:MAG: 30S ribosomal protein S16 [Nitrospirales bacterium]
MAVRLRLARTGRHKRPFYRVVAADARMPRDGRFLEVVGTFDPLKNPAVPELKQERVLDWLRKGAQPSVTVRTLLRRSGILKQFEESKK